MWKTAGLSIIKKHSGEMSVCMGQGQKPILNVCVLWTVNIKNRPSFIVGIWNFRKTMWANPVFRWHFKCKFKFYQARKELEKDSESHLLCLSPSSFKMDWDQVENCPVGKLKTTEKGKPPSVMVLWHLTALTVKAPLMLNNTYRLWSNVCWHSHLFQRSSSIF